VFFTSVWKNAVIVPLVGYTCHIQHSFLFSRFHPIINQLIIHKENAAGPCTKLGESSPHLPTLRFNICHNIILLSMPMCSMQALCFTFFDGNFVGISSLSSGMIQASHPDIQSHPPLSYRPNSIVVNG